MSFLVIRKYPKIYSMLIHTYLIYKYISHKEYTLVILMHWMPRVCKFLSNLHLIFERFIVILAFFCLSKFQQRKVKCIQHLLFWSLKRKTRKWEKLKTGRKVKTCHLHLFGQEKIIEFLLCLLCFMTRFL